jgi:hypothetical protein
MTKEMNTMVTSGSLQPLASCRYDFGYSLKVFIHLNPCDIMLYLQKSAASSNRADASTSMHALPGATPATCSTSMPGYINRSQAACVDFSASTIRTSFEQWQPMSVSKSTRRNRARTGREDGWASSSGLLRPARQRPRDSRRPVRCRCARERFTA